MFIGKYFVCVTGNVGAINLKKNTFKLSFLLIVLHRKLVIFFVFAAFVQYCI